MSGASEHLNNDDDEDDDDDGPPPRHWNWRPVQGEPDHKHSNLSSEVWRMETSQQHVYTCQALPLKTRDVEWMLITPILNEASLQSWYGALIYTADTVNDDINRPIVMFTTLVFQSKMTYLYNFWKYMHYHLVFW